MSETLQWAQSSSGSFEQSGAWLANGASTTDTPTAATLVQFATGSSSSYTVSGAGTAASLTSSDVLVLDPGSGTTVAVNGPLVVTAGTLSVLGTLTDTDASITAGTIELGFVRGQRANPTQFMMDC